MIDKLGQHLRQLRYPGPLRIADPGLPLPELSVEALRRLLAPPAGDPSVVPAAPPAADDVQQREFVRRIATATWHLGRFVSKLTPETGKRLRNRLLALEQLFREHDVVVHDFAGSPYDPNELFDEVIGSHTTKDQVFITDMREPRIVFRGAVIQRGTPVVGEVSEGERPS